MQNDFLLWHVSSSVRSQCKTPSSGFIAPSHPGWATWLWQETGFVHGGQLKPSMRAAVCVLSVMGCDRSECVFRTVCVYKQVDLVTALGYWCAGWAGASRNQEGSRTESCSLHTLCALSSSVRWFLSLWRCHFFMSEIISFSEKILL